MGRCIIITGGELGDLTLEDIAPGPEDTVLCCDRGYAHALALGIRPHRLFGDFDSYDGPLPKDIPVERFAPEKDDTDTMIALRWALKAGHRDILLVAATGGRLDHTLANIQALAFLADHGATGELLGPGERVWLLDADRITIPKREGYYLSVLAYGGNATGVWERGVEYSLTDATLTTGYPLGVSNHITADAAEISVATGRLLILQCRE